MLQTQGEGGRYGGCGSGEKGKEKRQKGYREGRMNKIRR